MPGLQPNGWQPEAAAESERLQEQKRRSKPTLNQVFASLFCSIFLLKEHRRYTMYLSAHAQYQFFIDCFSLPF